MQWSYTKLRALRDDPCPYAFWLARVQKVPQEVPDYVRDGARRHRKIEAFLEAALNTGTDWETLARSMNDPSRPEDDGFLLRFARALAEIGYPQEGESYLIEEAFSLDEDLQPSSWGDAFWRGRIDYLVVGGKRLLVPDWKTGWAYGDKSDLAQPIAYAASYLRMHPEEQPETIEAKIIRPQRGYHDERSLEPDEALRFLQTLIGEAKRWEKKLDQGEPEPVTGTHCASCWVRKSCHAFAALEDRQPFPTPQEAWARKAILEAELKEIRALLAATCESEGPFSVDRGTVDLVGSPTIKLAPDAVYRALKEAGVEMAKFWKAASVSPTSLKQALGKAQRDLAEAITAEHGKVSGVRKTLKWRAENGDEGSDEYETEE